MVNIDCSVYVAATSEVLSGQPEFMRGLLHLNDGIFVSACLREESFYVGLGHRLLQRSCPPIQWRPSGRHVHVCVQGAAAKFE